MDELLSNQDLLRAWANSLRMRWVAEGSVTLVCIGVHAAILNSDQPACRTGGGISPSSSVLFFSCGR